MSAPGPSEATLKKLQKATQYADEPHRFQVCNICATMISEHGVRRVEFVNGNWSCNCEFFPENGTCSHVMALDLILRKKNGMRLESPGECGGG
jgi:hypothetical protein